MRLEDLVPQKDDRKVLAFCEGICPNEKPFVVPVRPEGQMLQCFLNVPEKVGRDGGAMVSGWEISQLPMIYLEARFHAVWKSPAGQFVDVTPEELGQTRILFLPDVHRKYAGREVPRRRFSLAKDTALVERYWSLSDESIALMQSVALGGIRDDDPAFRAHIVSLQAELRRIRERLQNAA